MDAKAARLVYHGAIEPAEAEGPHVLPPKGDQLRIEYVELGSLTRWPRNPREHDLGAIHASISRFGYISPIIIDEGTGRIVAGHGRIDVLQQMKAAGKRPPSRIKDGGGVWLVPVVKGVGFQTDSEAEAYLIADNRTADLASWNDEGLAAMLSDLAGQDLLEGTGFDGDDVDTLLKDLGQEQKGAEDPGPQIDKAADLQKKWKTKRGQVWQVGKHRVMCGDSVSKESVEGLLSSGMPNLMVTDPPYGVEYDPLWRRGIRGKMGDVRATGDVPGDECVDWSAALSLFSGDVTYVWHAAKFAHLVATQLELLGYQIRSQIIWVKPHFAISRGHYHWRHEPCWYAVKKGSQGSWVGDHSQNTVWEVANLNAFGRNRDEKFTGHGTQKPVECMARPIRNHEGDVYDPFLGSGTTMVAAEQLGRICYGMEIEPKYVAVTLQRMADMGLKPKLIDGPKGETHKKEKGRAKARK